MEHAEHLGLVIVPFIGVDKIDVPAATRLGVLVANSPTKENFIAVAEATIGLLLMLLKRVKHDEAAAQRASGRGARTAAISCSARRSGIVGLGRIGTHVARRLASWDVRLLAADPYVPAERAAARSASRSSICRRCWPSPTSSSLHAVLTDETRALIGEKALRAMKPTAILVNTARGELVDEAAVARAARASAGSPGRRSTPSPRSRCPTRIRYRGVDPERLILTPHNIGHSEAGRRANLALALEQILAVGRGEPPAHVINPEAIPIWRMKR